MLINQSRERTWRKRSCFLSRFEGILPVVEVAAFGGGGVVVVIFVGEVLKVICVVLSAAVVGGIR